jgi:3-phenylpropionate/cinnamic acid dioxygenase small subunit
MNCGTIRNIAPNRGDAVASVDDRMEAEATSFLHREAELLDNREFHRWLEMVSANIRYRVPVRTTRQNKEGRGFSAKAFFLDEDHGSLKTRVLRLDSEFAWSENPATRTRRLVGNIRVRSATADTIEIASNLAIFCYRGDAAAPIILTAEREDILRWENGAWKLADRLVLLDTTVLGMESLSIFL